MNRHVVVDTSDLESRLDQLEAQYAQLLHENNLQSRRLHLLEEAVRELMDDESSDSSSPSSQSSVSSYSSSDSSASSFSSPINSGIATGWPTDINIGTDQPIIPVTGGRLWKAAMGGRDMGAWQASSPEYNVVPGARKVGLPDHTSGFREVTPQTFAASLADDARLLLRGGEYGPQVITQHGMQLRAYPDEPVTFTGPSGSPITQNAYTFNVRGNRNVLIGLKVRHGWHCMHITGNGTTVTDCEIIGEGVGLSKEGIQVGWSGVRPGMTVIEFCTVAGGVSDGMSLSGVSFHVVGCLIRGTDDHVEFDKSDNGTFRWNRLWGGANSAISLQGSGAGPYYVQHNQMTGAGSPFKTRAKSAGVYDHNTISMTNGSHYFNVFQHPDSKMRNNLWVSPVPRFENIRNPDGTMDPVVMEMDYNCYIGPTPLFNYAELQTIARMRAIGRELYGMHFLTIGG